MQEYFQNLDINKLMEAFGNEQLCLSFLAENKWKTGFVCRKCGNTRWCAGSKPFSRRCTLCKTQESATAHTTFHRCKIPLPQAFQLSWYVCHNPEMSLQELAEKMNMRTMTVWKMRTKIKECIKCNSGFIKP